MLLLMFVVLPWRSEGVKDDGDWSLLGKCAFVTGGTKVEDPNELI